MAKVGALATDLVIGKITGGLQQCCQIVYKREEKQLVGPQNRLIREIATGASNENSSPDFLLLDL